jgi:GNAT superfamily N-acetyltransferase
MNDFYDPRRTAIADIAGLVGMAIAGTLSSAFVWDTLASGFRTGKLEKAFFVFLLVVLGAAAIGGMLGLMAGRTIGQKWEERHRAHRPAVAPDEVVPVAADPTCRRASDEIAVTSAPGVVLRTFGADVADFMALVNRSGGDASSHTADMSRRSTNLGAWDGPRLVGAIRVVSDGRVGLVADLVVEPAYRRRGIARALGEAARRRAGGTLFFPAGPESASDFLMALGARHVDDAWLLEGRQ